jgi:hypothetical protein
MRTLILTMILLMAGTALAQTLGTGFTYQGRLALDGTLVDGSADLEIDLWNSPTGGSIVAGPIQLDNVPVVDGVFTVELDFGPGVFEGSTRWLEISVRAPHDPGDGEPFTTLTPRQEITAVPYALHALNGGSGGGDSGLWTLENGAIINIEDRFVGINRSTTISSNEVFGVHSDRETGYGGMYVSTTGNDAWPFYGYSAGSTSAWTYFDGITDKWHLNSAGNRLTVTRTGQVGIGTEDPGSRLTVAGLVESTFGGFRFPDGTVQTTAGGGTVATDTIELVDGDGATTVSIEGDDSQYNNGGQISLFSSAGQIGAKVWGDIGTSGAFGLFDNDGERTVTIYGQATMGAPRLDIEQEDGTIGMRLYGRRTGSTGSSIVMYNDAGQGSLTITGDHGATGESRIATDVLEITGGSDLSERFDVHEGADGAEPGSVVSIDPAAPGALRMSREPYDRRVAGIVSGAGGVNPGMLMGQPGTKADGELPVALTGRVYCKVDASFGAIEPGDLLTTSPTPGHAMKVTDHGQAQGAILGKAMTSLESGQGLVLVLVSLQ